MPQNPENNPQTRYPKRTIILGAPGTGKTTILKNILQRSGQKTLVVTPYMNEWTERDANGVELFPENKLACKADTFYTGIMRHIWMPKYTENRLLWFTRGIMVWDDCRQYLTAHTEQFSRNVLMSTRQNMVDIFAVAHGFTEVPPALYTFATDFILFRTEDKVDRIEKYIRNINLVKSMQEKVNRASVNDPHTFEWFKL